MNQPEEQQHNETDNAVSPHTKDSTATRSVDPAFSDVLNRYHEAVESGERVDIEKFSRQFPGREEQVKQIVKGMQDAEAQLQAVSPKQVLSGDGDKNALVGSSLTAATRFTRLRLHARGGLGFIFKAYDEEVGREVAVKVLAENRHAFFAESRERFLRESEVMGRLRHPGIVPILGRGETLDGRPFYVMPFLEEGSFEQAINQFHEDRPSYRASDPIFRDLLGRYMAACKTVAYAHSRGVVHRDLKPHNIMLGRYGETLVIDWGLAERSRREQVHRQTGEQSIEIRGSHTSSSTGGFTPQYASPEQLDGTVPIGPPSDVYSLGAILYKLISGVPPLTATTLGEMRQAGLKGDFPPPRERNASVPKPLQAICLKAMQTDPAQRYASPEVLVQDVEAFLADAPVSVLEEDIFARSARVVRRHWPVVLAAMAALLLIATVSFISAFTQRGLKQNARESSISRLQLAATLAAQAGGAEIDRRWRLLELEAAAPTVIDAVETLNSDPSDTQARDTLQAFLTERYVDAHHEQGIKFLSLFINGLDGEQFVRVPRGETIGKNFGYRHYFHGQHMDLPEDTSPPPAKRPVLSVVFISKNTFSPHVALSVPIWGTDPDGKKQTVIGRLGMAIAVGDLGMFDQLGRDEVPMLIETRKYNWDAAQSYGIVVHHPDYQKETIEAADSPQALPRVNSEMVDSLIAQWKRSTAGNQSTSALVASGFRDPLQGQPTEAAFARVTVPGRNSDVSDTGWLIVLHPRHLPEQ